MDATHKTRCVCVAEIYYRCIWSQNTFSHYFTTTNMKYGIVIIDDSYQLTQTF